MSPSERPATAARFGHGGRSPLTKGDSHVDSSQRCWAPWCCPVRRPLPSRRAPGSRPTAGASIGRIHPSGDDAGAPPPKPAPSAPDGGPPRRLRRPSPTRTGTSDGRESPLTGRRPQAGGLPEIGFTLKGECHVEALEHAIGGLALSATAALFATIAVPSVGHAVARIHAVTEEMPQPPPTDPPPPPDPSDPHPHPEPRPPSDLAVARLHFAAPPLPRPAPVPARRTRTRIRRRPCRTRIRRRLPRRCESPAIDFRGAAGLRPAAPCAERRQPLATGPAAVIIAGCPDPTIQSGPDRMRGGASPEARPEPRIEH